MALRYSGPNTNTPFAHHSPPVIRAASQSICELPPEISVFLSFPIEPNAIDRLSGDQKGSMALSVPGRSFVSCELRSLTYSMLFPSAEKAVNAIFCPSGEITAKSFFLSLNARFCGGVNESQIARSGVEERLRYIRNTIAAMTVMAPATIQGRRSYQTDIFVFSSAALAAVARPPPAELVGADSDSNANPRSCAE